jgi:flagellin
MSISVQNNSWALLALQTLSRLNDTSAQASDASSSTPAAAPSNVNPIIQALSTTSDQDVDAWGAATASLDRATSITDVALSAGQSVSDLLTQLKQAASTAASGGTASSADFADLVSQLSATISGAQFDGVNLLDGSQSGSVMVGAGSAGAVTLSPQNLSLGGAIVTLPSSADISTQTAAASTLSAIDASIDNVGSAMSQIGDQAHQIQSHASFVSRLSAVLGAGGTDQTSAASADSARLLALQVQQSLSSQGSSIANSAPQMLLSLFK